VDGERKAGTNPRTGAFVDMVAPLGTVEVFSATRCRDWSCSAHWAL